MRLIDANDVKMRGDCYPQDIRKTIANILSHTKTVKDAVVIVKCKDCKHYDGRPCGIVDWYNTADDFCSKAERRTE